MKTSECRVTQILSIIFLFLVFPGFIQAETTNCTAIPSVPYTISVPGIYCLTGNLKTSMPLGNAITINVNNVVIDLNGRKLGGGAAGAGTEAVGIYAHQRKNITIKNGTIRGFNMGVYVVDSGDYTTSQGHIIEDIRADMNTYKGLAVQGRGNIIRNNQVVDTGGSANNPIFGIHVLGSGARVLNNDIIETKAEGVYSAYGIYIDYPSSGTVVENNRIGNSSLMEYTYGIYVTDMCSNVLVSNNRVTLMKNGIFIDTASGAKYCDNLAIGCTTPYFGGTNAGNNN
jgi:nitrous oxidase accessory protein NosD